MRNYFSNISVPSIHTLFNIILFLIVLIIIFIGVWVEKPKQILKKEKQNTRIVFKIDGEDIKNINPKIKNAESKNQDLAFNKNSSNSIMPTKSSPVIAVIIGNLGLSKFITEKFTNMPDFITLGYSAYAANILDDVNKGILKHHDVLVNLPLEPLNYPVNDPGSLTLLRELSANEKLARINSVLKVLPEAVGVYAVEQENFTNSIDGSKFILENLHNANKVLLYGNNNGTILNQVANIYNYKMFTVDVRLDIQLSKASIANQLKNLEEVAKNKGVAIAYSNAYPMLADIIPEWAATLAAKNITILPLTCLKSKLKSDSE